VGFVVGMQEPASLSVKNCFRVYGFKVAADSMHIPLVQGEASFGRRVDHRASRKMHSKMYLGCERQPVEKYPGSL
jgi:hypothetical protein